MTEPEINREQTCPPEAISGAVHSDSTEFVAQAFAHRQISSPRVTDLLNQFNPTIRGQLAHVTQEGIDQNIHALVSLLEAPPNVWLQLSEPKGQGSLFVRGVSGNYASSEGLIYGGIIEAAQLLSGLATTDLRSAAIVNSPHEMEVVRRSIAGYARPISIAGQADGMVPGRTEIEASLPVGTTIEQVTAIGIFLPERAESAYEFSRYYMKLVEIYKGAGLELNPESCGMQFYSALKAIIRESADGGGILPRDINNRLFDLMSQFH